MRPEQVNQLKNEYADELAELAKLVDQGNDAVRDHTKRTTMKIDRVACDVGALSRRLDEVETVMGRPALGGTGPTERGDPERRRAVVAYLRLGPQAAGPDIMAALTTGSDPGGGYFLEPDQNGRLVQRIHETSPIRQLASVVQTGSVDALEGIADINEPAAGGWVGETDDRGETDTQDVGAYRIPLHEQWANPRVTQKMLDDGTFDVESWLVESIRRKLARGENTAFVTGNGVSKPRGFVDYGAAAVTTDDDTRDWGVLQYVPTGASGAFASSDPADVLQTTVFKLKAEFLANASWVMNRATMAEVAKLKDGQGNYLLAAGDVRNRTPFQILGFPVVLAEDMPKIAADSFSIAFGDFRAGYQIVDHARGVAVLRDPFTKKGFVKFYTTRRVGADVVDFDAIKLIKFAAS